MSKKNKIKYICQKCSYQSAQWMGKCPECMEWNTFVEELMAVPSSVGDKGVDRSGLRAGMKRATPRIVEDIESKKLHRISTGVQEFDRAVGGGLVPGSLILIGGEPGIGKSTLLLDVCGKLAMARPNDNVLYVSGEESESQVAERGRRLGIGSSNFYILNECSWQNVLEYIKELRPAFLVLDSIQTTISSEIPSAPGTVSQIREVTYELMNYTKASNMTSFVIGHITKEGTIAGPKILEHMVDTVIYFEGDQLGQYRLLRIMKNRFGNTNEVGIFEMGESGLREVPNPSEYFLDTPIPGSFGRSLTCIIEGSRPIFIEVQALVIENKFGNGRRTTQGVDSNRVSMLVAIVEKYFGLPLSMNDIYVNIVGGLKVNSREIDLSIIASLLSSLRSKPIEDRMVFIGEVGLTGEVRSVPKMEMRIKEMAQLKYKKVVTSRRVAQEFGKKFDIEIIGIEKASQLESVLFSKK